MTCLFVKVKADAGWGNSAFAVLRRESTVEGLIYHLCDGMGKYLGSIHESQILLAI